MPNSNGLGPAVHISSPSTSKRYSIDSSRTSPVSNYSSSFYHSPETRFSANLQSPRPSSVLSSPRSKAQSTPLTSPKSTFTPLVEDQAVVSETRGDTAHNLPMSRSFADLAEPAMRLSLSRVSSVVSGSDSGDLTSVPPDSGDTENALFPPKASPKAQLSKEPLIASSHTSPMRISTNSYKEGDNINDRVSKVSNDFSHKVRRSWGLPTSTANSANRNSAHHERIASEDHVKLQMSEKSEAADVDHQPAYTGKGQYMLDPYGRKMRVYKLHKGDNKFYARGHVLTSVEPIWPFLATITVGFGLPIGFLVFNASWLWQDFHPNNGAGKAVVVLFAYFSAMMVTNMLKTAWRDPGICVSFSTLDLRSIDSCATFSTERLA